MQHSALQFFATNGSVCVCVCERERVYKRKKRAADQMQRDSQKRNGTEKLYERFFLYFERSFEKC